MLSALISLGVASRYGGTADAQALTGRPVAGQR